MQEKVCGRVSAGDGWTYSRAGAVYEGIRGEEEVWTDRYWKLSEMNMTTEN